MSSMSLLRAQVNVCARACVKTLSLECCRSTVNLRVSQTLYYLHFSTNGVLMTYKPTYLLTCTCLTT